MRSLGGRLRETDPKELAIDIIVSEIRSAQREVWLEASRLVLTLGEPTEIARKMRDRAERAIRSRVGHFPTPQVAVW